MISLEFLSFMTLTSGQRCRLGTGHSEFDSRQNRQRHIFIIFKRLIGNTNKNKHYNIITLHF
jgi:hypothetical protein